MTASTRKDRALQVVGGEDGGELVELVQPSRRRLLKLPSRRLKPTRSVYDDDPEPLPPLPVGPILEGETVEDVPDTAPVPVDQPVGATVWAPPWKREEERHPLLPAWVTDPEEREQARLWLVRHSRYVVAFHAVRAPSYAAKLALSSPRGAARAIASLSAWLGDGEAAPLRQNAVQKSDHTAYAKLSAQQQERMALRGIVLLAALGVVVGAWFLLGNVGPSWDRKLLVLAALGYLGYLGRRKDKPLITPAVVVHAARRLTADVVLRAYLSAKLCKLDDLVTFATPIHRDGEGWGVTLDLPYGTTFEQAMQRRVSLASGLDVVQQQVFLMPAKGASASARRVVMWVSDVDPLSVSPGRSPLIKAERVDFWKPFPFGVDERGNIVTLCMLWLSILVGAVPRQGKTFSARLIALAAALDPYVRLYVYDGKGSPDWRAFAKVAHRTGFGLVELPDGTDPAELLLNDLQDLKSEAQRRYQRLAELPVSVCPEGKLTPELSRRKDFGMPVVLVVLDEVQEYLTHPEFGKQILEVVTYLVRVAPAVGISVLSATQKPDEKACPPQFRDQHQARFCLRVSAWQVSDVILGAGSYSEGLDASRLLPSHKGVGLLKGIQDTGQTVRTYLADGADASAILDRARALREEEGTLSGGALGEQPEIDRGPSWSVVDDLLTVFGPMEEQAHSDDLCARLVDNFPDRYEGWEPAQLASALKPYDVTTRQVWAQPADGGPSVNRRGVRREDVLTAVETRTETAEQGDAA